MNYSARAKPGEGSLFDCRCDPPRPEGRSWFAHQPGCPERENRPAVLLAASEAGRGHGEKSMPTGGPSSPNYGMPAKLQFPEEGQLALLPDPGPRLSDRQELVLEHLRRAGQDGLTDDEAGTIWHNAKGYHATDTRCDYCAKTRRGILDALDAKGLARYRRSNRARSIPGAWLATNLADDAADDTSLPRGMTDEIPY